MNLRRSWTLGFVVLAGAFGGACQPQPHRALTTGQREAIQTRVTATFASAVFFKPVDAGSELPLEVRLAPLIIQQVTQTNAAALGQDQFDLPNAPLQVQAESGVTILNNRSHKQFTYIWTYPAGTPPISLARMVQGVRLTLNAADAPVIWEVLTNSSGGEIIYVAESLELAAGAQFGPPAPGRKFSIERELPEAPNVVVANVIADGPLPMGPIVYLSSGARDVNALICRCMPAQTGTLLGQKDYQLEHADPAAGQGCRFAPAQLERRLRLPRGF